MTEQFKSANAAVDRIQLQALVEALDTWSRALRREIIGRGRDVAYGDWRIEGKRGHIYVDGPGFLIFVSTNESKPRWTRVKTRLVRFCRLIQDGDDEGCFHLDHLPNPAKAGLIREAIRLRRRMHQSPEALARLRLTAFKPSGGVQSAARLGAVCLPLYALPNPLT